MLVIETTITEKIKRNKSENSESLKLFNETLTDEIFHALAELTHLKKLEIVGCKFTDMPDSMSNLIELHALVLKENHLEKLPLVITKLTKLKFLNISGNLLVTLPNELERLRVLFYLDISYNSFSIIPEPISKLQSIKELNLSNNPITDFSVFEKLENLNKLYLNGNTLPFGKSFSEISFLKNLSYLHLDANNFNEFPIQILDLIELRELNLSNNQISKIPAEINCLEQLQSIDLQNNNFEQFPVQLLALPNLARLLLSGNPFALSELKFAYTLSEKIDFHSLNLKGLQFNSIYKTKEILYLEDMNNGILISLLQKKNYSDSNDPLAPFREFSFSIQVFGNEETKKSVLKKIRILIDQWIEKERKEFVIKNEMDEQLNIEEGKEYTKRYFYYPLVERENSRAIPISFDQLLAFENAGENTYFANKYQKKIPVKDLLDYIGVDENELKRERAKKEWKGKSYLTEIKIDNFKIFNHLEINLSEHFNIILGRNGLGKTSILQGITLGLLPLDNLDKSNDFVDYINMLHNDNKAEILLTWGDEHKRAYIFKNELNEEEYINFPQKLILSYGVNLNTDPKLDHTKIVENIIKGNALSYSTKSIFTDYSVGFHDPLIILEELILNRNEENNKVIDDIIHLIINTLNHYLGLIENSDSIHLEGVGTNSYFETFKMGGQLDSPMISRNAKGADFYFIDINGNQLKTRHLSEGYRDHILLVTDILIRILASRNEIFGKDEVEVTESFFKEVNGVILIDEFDRHLHPVWQRKLLSRFKEDFPKIQFILTTHNPFSVQSAVGANAIELVVEDKTIKTVNKTIESRNILSIIREYFTKDFFDYETQEQMKQLSKYLDEIDEGNTDLAYSPEFKNIVASISEKSDELKSIIGSQLLQLNATLKKLNRKEFEL